MSGISEFLDFEEFSSVIMNALPEKYKKSGEWEFTINYEDKNINTLELWKTKLSFTKT
jgi:hypothetical protein